MIARYATDYDRTIRASTYFLVDYLHFCSGNHERNWSDTGSFYGFMDSAGECGVLAETMFYIPAENRAKSW